MRNNEVIKLFHDHNEFSMSDFEVLGEIGKGAFSVVFEAI
jgi:hypothetical protein